MAIPTISDNGGEDFYFLGGDDRGYLRALIDRERMRQEHGSPEDRDDTYISSPEVLIVKLPIDGIDARDDNIPGCAKCEIFRIKPDNELDPHGEEDSENGSTLEDIKNPDDSVIKEWIYNIYPVKWYSGGRTVYARATKDRFGNWLIEKPQYTIKVKPRANINVDTAGDCRVFSNGVGLEVEDDVSVKLNWMSGGEKISANKEAYAEYREDEGTFVFVNAECE